MKTLFNHLISEAQTQSFFNAFKKNEAFCVHDLNQTVELFEQVDFLRSLDDLIKAWEFEADVHLSDSRDEHTTMTAPNAALAFEEFKKGQSLLFNDVNRQEPGLEDWLEDIRLNLKLSANTFSRCLVYTTPAGGGNAPHFDQNINFVLQLSGEKTWWTAPNTSVSHPVHRHVIGQETDPELAAYADAPMPKVFPEQAEQFNLKPGSLLYVPPGVWHRTEATTDAMSLNFTFSTPPLMDLIGLALRGRLMSSEIWREQAVDLKNPEQIEKLDFLIQHLAEDMSTWSAKDLLNALE